MLEAYSINATVGSLEPIPFNNVSVKKGTTAELSGVSSIQLNKCGVYMIAFDCSSATATTVQLYKNGVAQDQAQATGTNPSFTTLVQVTTNNSCCPCSSPTIIQILNASEAEATLTSANVTVTKIV